MSALLVSLLLVAAVFVLATSGVLVGPAYPRAGPEEWIVGRLRRGPRTRP